jgi:hypothetical protein
MKLNIQQRPHLKLIALVTGIALIGALVIGARRVLPILSVAAGLKAGHMCSAVFVAGRNPDAGWRSP